MWVYSLLVTLPSPITRILTLPVHAFEVPEWTVRVVLALDLRLPATHFSLFWHVLTIPPP